MGIQHIDINGKRYDARTGKLLSQDLAPAAPKPAAVPAARTQSRQVADVARSTTQSKHVHSNTQRSQTLMRSTVKRPAKLTTPKTASSKSVVDVSKPVAKVTPKPLAARQLTDPARAERASKVMRSEHVRKFSDFAGKASAIHPSHQPVTARVEPLPVAQAPAHAAAAHAPAKSSSIIENGLRNAQSHNQPVHHAPAKRTRKHGRLVSLGAGGLAVMLLGAFILYQNVPNISMRYASQRAGITAQMPNYQPSGFALSSKIKYTPGQIEMDFRSNTDDRSFTITQRESAWNSDTLMSNYVANASDQVHTYEDRGRTIYLYGDSNATWVNGGVWYDIQGNSQLNSDQLIRIATSM